MLDTRCLYLIATLCINLFPILINSSESDSHVCTENIDCQNGISQTRIDCDASSGWHCDYEPDFSHRNGDHAFCDLAMVSLDDKLI